MNKQYLNESQIILTQLNDKKLSLYIGNIICTKECFGYNKYTKSYKHYTKIYFGPIYYILGFQIYTKIFKVKENVEQILELEKKSVGFNQNKVK